ncbi:unnamed protein product [Prorocentrum cordatum]|uniref:Uncharacterized protein n=1 Tax=Prorocentrum cordatum TaxID=2364126 RepID=A0ABN9RS31_9DINO|nr:unnamed protein product [Polarella glacialis]
MASMMQDQNMQQLLSQLTQTMPGPTKKLHPDDPFLDPSFIGQMFHAPTVHSVAMLQQAVEQLSMTADFAAEEKPVAKAKSDKPAAKASARGAAEAAADQQLLPDSSQVLSGLNPKSPAANFKDCPSASSCRPSRKAPRSGSRASCRQWQTWALPTRRHAFRRFTRTVAT